MQATQQNLLRLLADAELHSGTKLAAELGLTRAAVWKTMQQLEALGVEVQAVKGKGYRLAQPAELLDEQAIRSAMPPAASQRVAQLEVLWQTESTSDHLLAADAVPPGQCRVCVAEFQTGGRGRRGRPWFAAAGSGICLSLSWSFNTSPQPLSCLGLAAGVGVLRAVHAAGAAEAQLKWPNDVMLNDAKLAGILLDVQGEAGGPMRVVVGVGLNYRLPGAAVRQVVAAGGVRPASLLDAATVNLSRNAMVAKLIAELQQVMLDFAARGFSYFADDWRAADYLRGKRVRVLTDAGETAGRVRGIAADGRLQVETGAGIEHLANGDVSIRSAAK